MPEDNYKPSVYDIGRAEAEGQQYKDRLGAVSTRERFMQERLGQQSIEETQRQLYANQLRAQADIQGSTVGLGPAGMRQASYGGSQIRQQGATEAELIKAMEEQALREQQLALLGRQGNYAVAGEAGAAGLMGLAYQSEAAEADREARERIADLWGTYQGIGQGLSVVGSVLGVVGSEREMKRDIMPVNARTEDEAIDAIVRGLREEEGKALGAAPASGPQRYTYEYKPGISAPGMETPPGQHYGFMADELAATKLGKGMVIERGGKKGINPQAAAVGALGLTGRVAERQADQERRLRALENYGPPASANPNRGGGDERMFNAMARERPQGVYDTGTSLVGAREDYIPGARPLTGDVRSEGARLRYGNEYLMPDGSIRRVPANFPAAQGGLGAAAEQIGGAKLQTVPAPNDEELFRVAHEMAMRGY